MIILETFKRNGPLILLILPFLEVVPSGTAHKYFFPSTYKSWNE